MKFKKILLIYLLPFNLLALECGQYHFKGVVRNRNNEFFLVVNENTKSEISIKSFDKDDITLMSLENRFLNLEANIIKSTNTLNWAIDFKNIIPAPPHAWGLVQEKTINLIKAIKCTN